MNPLKSVTLGARPEIPLPLSLSVSKVKTFKDCQAKYRYGYIEKLPRKEWDFHVFGKFLHEILESFFREIIGGSVEPSNILMSTCFKRSCQNWQGKITPEQVKESKEILNQFLKQYAEEKAAGIAPTILGVEKEFYIDVDGKVLLNGFIDRTQIDSDGMLHVSDYKTTKNKRYLKNDFFQLLTYAFVMCLEDPSIERVRTSYILLRHDFETMVKEFSREEVMKVEDIFLDYASKIESEKLFRPSPSKLCEYCDYLEHCDAGQRITGHSGSITKFGAHHW